MAYELENIVREWMDHLKGLNVEVKKNNRIHQLKQIILVGVFLLQIL